MNTRKLIGISSFVVLTTGVLSGCASTTSSSSPNTTATGGTSASTAQAGGSASPALETLYNKAIAAGQTNVVIYGPSAGTDTAMYTAFKKEFPKITVTGVPVVGPPMTAKLSAEFASGKHVADIAYTGNTNMMQYQQSNYFASYTPLGSPGASQMVADNIGPNNSFYGVTVGVAGIVTNTNTVKNPPTQWSDFSGSTYKGQITMYDPTAIGEMADIFARLALVPSYSGVPAALKASDPQVYPASSLTGPVTAVAQGAKEIGLEVPYIFYLPAKVGGAPVAFSLLKSDNYTVTLYMGQLKGAPDPLASELYESWTYTPQAAAAIASEGEYSAILGMVAPQSLPPLATIPVFPGIPLTNIITAQNDAVVKAKALGY